MKKFFAITLIFAMLLSTAACSLNKKVIDVDFSRGTVADGMYASDFLGVYIVPDEGWRFCSDEEIAENTSYNIDILSSDDIFNQTDYICDAECDDDNGSAICIYIERWDKFSIKDMDDITALEINAGAIEDAYRDSDGEVQKNEIGEIEINGAVVPCLYTNIYYAEFDMFVYQATIPRNQGELMGSVEIVTVFEEKINDIAQMVSFSKEAAEEKLNTVKEYATEEISFSRGTIENGVYTNTSTGITFAIGDGLRFYTDEEIAERNDYSMELFGLDGDTILRTVDYFVEMGCINDETGDNISINTERWSADDAANTDEEDYLEIVKYTFEEFVANEESYEIKESKMTEAEINGSTVPAYYGEIYYAAYDMSIYEMNIVKKTGTVFSYISIGTVEKSQIDNILSMISFD